MIDMPGTENCRSSIVAAPRLPISSAVMALTDMGTSKTRCSRFWAVTMTSSSSGGCGWGDFVSCFSCNSDWERGG